MEESLENHECPWRTKAYELTKKLEEKSRRIDQLERMLFGKRSKKMPKVLEKPSASSEPELVQETRQERRAQRQVLPERTIEYKVKETDRHCQKCGSTDLKKVGEGSKIQETLACPCGEYVVTAGGPIRPTEGGSYGPAFMAHVVTAKCCDSLPLYRMEKQFKRLGLPLSRSTGYLPFHACAMKPHILLVKRFSKSLHRFLARGNCAAPGSIKIMN